MELASYFLKLLCRVEPTERHVARAKSAHEELREHLRQDPDVSKAHIDTYLSGSYARRTAIKDINDVDVICILDVDPDKTEPIVLLRWLEASLLKYYSNVTIQGRSIGVTTSDGFNLDVVPAVPMGKLEGPIRIPDREAKIWVPTNPKGQIEFSQARNDSMDGCYVQLVKMEKHWRDRILEASQAKSYILECLVAESAEKTPPKSHATAVVNILEGMRFRHASLIGSGKVPEIRDPGYPPVVVTKRWKPQEFDAFMSEALKAASLSRSALEERDENRSIRLWRGVFGPEFAA